MCSQPDRLTTTTSRFAIKKTKVVKDILNKKTPVTSTTAPILQFLQTKK